MEFWQFADPDTTQIPQYLALCVTEAITVQVGLVLIEIAIHDPDGVRGFEVCVILTFLDLLVDEGGPDIAHAIGKAEVNRHLDFNLKHIAFFVPGFHVHDGQLVLAGFLFVVRIEDFNPDHGRFQFVQQNRIQEMDEQVGVIFIAQDGFEDAIYFGVDLMLHVRAFNKGFAVVGLSSVAVRCAACRGTKCIR